MPPRVGREPVHHEAVQRAKQTDVEVPVRPLREREVYLLQEELRLAFGVFRRAARNDLRRLRRRPRRSSQTRRQRVECRWVAASTIARVTRGFSRCALP